MFLNYSWKGNIREVENVISYIVENSDDDAEVLTPENLPQLILERLRDDKKNAYNLENAEKELIIKALNDFGQQRPLQIACGQRTWHQQRYAVPQAQTVPHPAEYAV